MKTTLLFLFVFSSFILQAQWEPAVRLTNDPANSRTSINNQRCVATTGDSVHIAWYDNRSGNDEIYYERSLDAGVTWGAPVRLTNNSSASYHPSIAVNGMVVHVVWDDMRSGNEEVYYKRSVDGGETWIDDVRLSVGDTSSTDPSIATHGNLVMVTWYDFRDGNWEVYYKRSVDGGVTWEPDTRLTNNSANSMNSSVSLSGDTVHITWGDYRDSPNGDIYYKRSIDGGATWGSDTPLTTDPAVSRRSSVFSTGSEVHVVWYDFRNGNNEIYYKNSMDGGTNWGADTRLSIISGNSFNPSVTAIGNAVHVVWYDTHDNDLEIYYVRSEDKGMTWGAEQRMTSTSGASENPFIAVSESIIHVIWSELKDGNPEIYYQRNPTGGFAVGDHALLDDPSSVWIIYPNPAQTSIRIQNKENSFSSVHLNICTMMGEMLFSGEITCKETVDVSGLEAGMYLVSINQDNQPVVYRKLMIRK